MITLAIQAPGNLAVVIYQLLSGAHAATWLPFLSSFIQQSILIIEIAFFDCYWNKRKGIQVEEVFEDEHILPSEDESTQHKSLNY